MDNFNTTVETNINNAKRYISDHVKKITRHEPKINIINKKEYVEFNIYSCHLVSKTKILEDIIYDSVIFNKLIIDFTNHIIHDLLKYKSAMEAFKIILADSLLYGDSDNEPKGIM